MFATRDIKYGEELSFDYKSVTESEKEYESAICLCGSFKCIGRFLSLSHSKKFTIVMKQHHTFVDRNYLLWYACVNPEITPEDRKILDKHGIKSSLITPDVPNWLEKWASLILRFCEYEKDNIIQPLKELNPNYTDLQCESEARNILSNRISNIAITLDKVKHCLECMGTKEAPFRKVPYKEVFCKFWSPSEQSFRFSLFHMLEKIEESELKEACMALFFKASEVEYTDTLTEEECEKSFLRVLEILKELSLKLRKIKSKVVFTEPMADILY